MTRVVNVLASPGGRTPVREGKPQALSISSMIDVGRAPNKPAAKSCALLASLVPMASNLRMICQVPAIPPPRFKARQGARPAVSLPTVTSNRPRTEAPGWS